MRASQNYETDGVVRPHGIVGPAWHYGASELCNWWNCETAWNYGAAWNYGKRDSAHAPIQGEPQETLLALQPTGP